MSTVLGIDEAGKGPVIGPLIMVGALIEESKTAELKSLGVRDSKLILPNKREELYKKILPLLKDHKVVIVSTNEIDSCLDSSDSNLNWLEAKHSADIINELKPDKAILDCPSPNIKAYTAHIKNLLKVNVDLKAEHNAESNAIVAAASIIAKTIREEKIKELKEDLGVDFGSGYPSDPVTKEFLEKHHKDHENVIRKSWNTYKNLINKKNQKKLGDF